MPMLSGLSEQQRAAIDYMLAAEDRITPARWAMVTREPLEQRRSVYRRVGRRQASGGAVRSWSMTARSRSANWRWVHSSLRMTCRQDTGVRDPGGGHG